MKTNLEKRVLSFISQYKMTNPNETVTVALSGGADSVCLLMMLNSLREELNINIQAVHINHHLRGEESMRDERFCRNLCDKYNIKLKVYDVDVEKRQNEYSESCEEAARNLRYEIFFKYDKIATAHTASDNLETSLYNYMRGSGLDGISGIPPMRDNKIIRPLLLLTRLDIESYLSEIGENYVTDSTNLTDDYSRNRIRHHLVPEMKNWNMSIEKTSVSNLEALRSDLDFISCESDKAYKEMYKDNALYGINKYHRAIKERCIVRFLKENNLSYNFKRIRDIENCLENGGKIDVSEKYYIICDTEKICLQKKIIKEIKSLRKELEIGNNSIFEGRTVHIEYYEDENTVKMLMFNKKLTKYILDCDKIKGVPILRNRSYGDKIQPYNRDFHVSVKKWIQSKVEKSQREYLHFIEDEEGLIFAESIGIAKRVMCDVNTKRIYIIKVGK